VPRASAIGQRRAWRPGRHPGRRPGRHPGRRWAFPRARGPV